MITVNATLLVQCVHFLFAWWFLDRFLFRDFVKDINNQENRVKNLALSVDHERALLQEAYSKKSAQWDYYKDLFAKNSPIILRSFHLSFSTVLCPLFFEVTEDQKQKLTKDATDALVKRVLDA